MRQKPKLALLTFDFAPDTGGVQNYLFETAQRLSQWCQVTVISPVPAGQAANQTFHRKHLKSTSTVAIWQALKSLKSDIVLVGHAHPKILVPVKLFGKYGLITYGNDFLAGQKRWHRPLFNALIRKAKPLITISQASERKLNALGIQPDVVICPGTDPKRFTPRNTAVSHPPTLLTVARLVPRKGIDTVIRTLPKLRQTFPDLRYLIGGQGPDFSRLQSLATELKVTDSVQFLGFIPDEKLPEVYRSADIFVMPARETGQRTSVEGFGIVFLEASASGLPVVASTSGGIGEAVLDGTTGLLVEPDNVSELSQVLFSLLESPEKRSELGQNGRRWVEENMSWDQTALKFAEALGIDVT